MPNRATTKRGRAAQQRVPKKEEKVQQNLNASYIKKTLIWAARKNFLFKITNSAVPLPVCRRLQNYGLETYKRSNISLMLAMYSSFHCCWDKREYYTCNTKMLWRSRRSICTHCPIFNAETRERKKMVKREKTLPKKQKMTLAYETLLEEGRARLVLYDPYQRSHGVWSSKFPTEKNPYMLDERASYATITSLLEQYPHAALLYKG